jgi:hypothetical protein
MIDANKILDAVKRKLDGMTEAERVEYLKKMGFEFDRVSPDNRFEIAHAQALSTRRASPVRLNRTKKVIRRRSKGVVYALAENKKSKK